MFFSLTDEQRALQATVREFIGDKFPLSAVRDIYDDEHSDGDPAELWKSIGEQGWLAVLIPEKYDGLGLGLLDAAVLARCWGEGCVPGPFLPTLVAAEAIRLGGSPAQRSEWLPRVAGGQAKLTLPAACPGTGSGTKLPGTVEHVDYAHVADGVIVGPEEGALWLVDPAQSSVPVAVHEPRHRSPKLTSVGLDAAPAGGLPGAVLPEVLDRGAVLAAN